MAVGLGCESSPPRACRRRRRELGYAVVEIARPILRVEAAVAALLGQLALLGRLRVP